MTPTRRIPATHTRHAKIIQPNMVQKATRYPLMRASGEDRSAAGAWALITDDAMTCVRLRPIAAPSCAHVLKTAPLRACMLFGKTSEMTSRPTVKRTSQLMGVRIYNRPS